MVVVGATVVSTEVVAGAVVVVGAAVVVGTRVVVGTAVVVGAAVVVATGAVVVTGATVSVPPLHPEATNRNVRTTAYFLTVSVCHPTPGGVGATSEALGIDARSRLSDGK